VIVLPMTGPLSRFVLTTISYSQYKNIRNSPTHHTPRRMYRVSSSKDMVACWRARYPRDIESIRAAIAKPLLY
jgi:hypothetical protein